MKPFEARYTIPQELHGNGMWPPEPAIARRYSLPAGQVDIGRMLEEFRGGIEARYQGLTQRLAESPVWGEGMSLRSVPEAEKRFEHFTGTIRLGEIPSAYESFYAKHGRTNNRDDGRREVRGARYYVNVDASKPKPAEKNAAMMEDWRDGVEILKNAPEAKPGDVESFLARLGVLDYLKQHSLNLFHAFTYPERLGDKLNVENYAELRKKAFELARDSVRSYYLTLLGRDDASAAEYERRLGDFSDIARALDRAGSTKYYKSAEIDHPVVILTNADAAADLHPDSDVIVSLPSGGTQIGFATELVSEIKYGNRPHVVALPLSTHSNIQTLSIRATREELEQMLVEEGVKGKKVLVADDNSNSGNSIQQVVDMLERVGAGEVSVNLAELDPMRIIHKHTHDAPEMVAHMLHEDFGAVAGIVPITRGNELPLQVRKLISQHILRKHYERSQPEIGVTVAPHPFERSQGGFKPYLVTNSENKKKAGHRFGMRVFNGDSSAVDEAESRYDAEHVFNEGVIPPGQAGEYMRGVAMAKLDGVCAFIEQQGAELASTDANAYAREAAVPPSIVITDTNLILGETLLKKPATATAARNILAAYEQARDQQSEVRYVTHVGRVDINDESAQRHLYQVAVTVGRLKQDADLGFLERLLSEKPDRVGGIGSFAELMQVLSPSPIILEVTKWSERENGQFEQTSASRHVLAEDKMTPDVMSMLTRGFVPNR